MHNLSGDPIDILIKHNHWATAQVLAACSRLTGEQLHRRFDIGPGSLHDALTHTIGAMLRWSDRIAERPIKPSIEAAWPAEIFAGQPIEMLHGKPSYTPAQLGTLLRHATDSLQRVADDVRAATAVTNRAGLNTGFTTTFADGSLHRLSKGGALVHVTTHGMHHRAQCLNMLRYCGDAVLAEKLPPSSVTEWQEVGEPGWL